MSAPMVLTPDQLVSVAQFLRALTAATKEHSVSLVPYGRAELTVGDATISFNWDGEQYVLDDRVGD
jgi:hypothetical protein